MVVWPNGKRIAVMMSFDVDAELMWLQRGDGNADHITNLSKGAYGPKEGIPRLVRILNKHNVKGTFYVPAWVAEQHTEEIRLLVQEGHEIAYHGYYHESEGGRPQKEMEEIMEKSEQVMRKLYGIKMVGHRSPDAAYNDYSIAMYYRRGYFYSSDARDYDKPYFQKINGKEIPFVEFPKESLYDDATYYFVTDSLPVRDNIKPPSFVLENLKADFDALANLGDRCISYIFHPQLSGRPGRAGAIDELLTYMLEKGAWIAPAKEVAAYMIAQHGPFL